MWSFFQPSRLRVSKCRYFDGKKYDFFWYFTNRTQAEIEKARLQNLGYNVRITKRRLKMFDDYEVWVRKRG